MLNLIADCEQSAVVLRILRAIEKVKTMGIGERKKGHNLLLLFVVFRFRVMLKHCNLFFSRAPLVLLVQPEPKAIEDPV